MRNNLLHKEAAEAIIARVSRLTSDNKALWGKMNATEMLIHANLCNEEIFEGKPFTEKTTVKQFLLRLLALYIAPHFKKNIKGDARKETLGKIDTSHFHEQKIKFIENIKRFPEHKGAITLPHIAFGNLSTNEWGIAAYKHMDHHLRQFEV